MTAADWLKFLPGWFAAAVAVWTLFDKGRSRRHKLAFGPDDDALRADLTTLRRWFRAIQDEERRQDWFKADERRDMVQMLLDHSSRRTDPILTSHVSMTAITWHWAVVHAPPAQGPRVRWLDHETTPEERTATEREREQFSWQRVSAEQGLKSISAALKRLNELERRTIGRS